MTNDFTLEMVAESDPPGIQHILPRFEGLTVFDVGGNVGQSVGVFADRFERVVSIEPADNSFPVLHELCDRLTDAGSVRAECFAIKAAATDHDGMVTLAKQENHWRRGQLSSPESDSDSSEPGSWGQILEWVEVPAVKLDSLAYGIDGSAVLPDALGEVERWQRAPEAFGAPDLIKIDVEGHEAKVLLGAMTIIDLVRPNLFVEIHGEHLGDEILEMLTPFYGRDLQVVRHPHYAPTDVQYLNHWFLVAGVDVAP